MLSRLLEIMSFHLHFCKTNVSGYFVSRLSLQNNGIDIYHCPEYYRLCPRGVIGETKKIGYKLILSTKLIYIVL